jgi:hypothetical protein
MDMASWKMKTPIIPEEMALRPIEAEFPRTEAVFLFDCRERHAKTKRLGKPRRFYHQSATEFLRTLHVWQFS